MRFSKKLYSTPTYAKWRTSIFERDNFTCRLCLKNDCYIEAHHILPKSKYPALLLEKTNGITLCGKGRWSCHKRVTGKEFTWAPLFKKILAENIWDPRQLEQLIYDINANSKALIKAVSANGNKRKRKYRRKVKKVKKWR